MDTTAPFGRLTRRGVLAGSVSAGLLGGCATVSRGPAGGATNPLAPLRASPSRLFDVTVCLRPFRAAGPRIDPVEFTDRYTLPDHALAFPRPKHALAAGDPDFASPDFASPDFASFADRIRDLGGHSEPLPPGATPFAAPFVCRSESLQFNIAEYGHTLLLDFLAAGGTLRRLELHTPADLARIPERVVINCTGYGARAL